MSVIFNKNITGIYPAYNDSYISFYSDDMTPTKAIITIEGVIYPFTINPDNDGNFLFNLKESIKLNFNLDGFGDIEAIGDEDGYFESNPNLHKKLNVELFLVDKDSDNTDYISIDYDFYKGVKQTGEKLYTNNSQLLNYSTNGIDYNLSYNEGFEFYIDLMYVESGKTIKIVNTNTTEFFEYITTNSGSQRIWLDKGNGTNTTLDLTLPLTYTVNKLNIFIDDVFSTNVNIKKIPSDCGVYLKWFNSNGGYSFHKFYNETIEEIKTKSLSNVVRNQFLNVNESPKSGTYSLGKTSEESIKVKTRVDKNEYEILKDITSSPSVEMYSNNNPFIKGEWVNVDVSGNLKNTTKKHITIQTLTIQLPVKYNITY